MTGLPDHAMAVLDGQDLESKIGQTFLLATTDDEGWPHVAFLSVGEVRASSPTRVGLSLHRGTGSARAFARSGRALLVLRSADAPIRCRLRLRRAVSGSQDFPDLTAFDTSVERCREDRVPYATVDSWIEHALADPEEVLIRWESQIRWLEEQLRD